MSDELVNGYSNTLWASFLRGMCFDRYLRIMKRDITYVPPDCSFHDAVKMLYEMKISCLAVTDDGNKLLGIVTVTDVIRGLPAAYALFEKVLA